MAVNLGMRIVDEVDIRIFNIDWSPWLRTNTIAASSWVTPAGLTSLNESNTTTRTSIKVSGWVDGASYTFFNTVTTSDGQTRRVSFTIECE